MKKAEAYLYPKTAEEAVALLQAYQGKALVMSGGTDLMLWLKHGTRQPDALVDVDGVEELRGISRRGDTLVIGAGVTHADAAEHPLVNELFPSLAKGCGSVGAPQTRNIGTLGGNIVSAQPAGDASVNLTALGASCEILSPEGRRIVPVESLFLGVGRSAVNPAAELLTKIFIPIPAEPFAVSYRRIAPRNSLALPVACVSVLLLARDGKLAEARVVAAPVAVTPCRAKATEALLTGRPLEEAGLAAQAGGCIQKEINPRDSKLRGSGAYRKALVGTLTEDAVTEALGRLGEKLEKK